jgi:hypothetical protein
VPYIDVNPNAQLILCTKCWCVTTETAQGLHDKECHKK